MDILQTRNPTWGFFGTFGRHDEPDVAWALASQSAPLRPMSMPRYKVMASTLQLHPRPCLALLPDRHCDSKGNACLRPSK
jgi:hypothetical protein